MERLFRLACCSAVFVGSCPMLHWDDAGLEPIQEIFSRSLELAVVGLSCNF